MKSSTRLGVVVLSLAAVAVVVTRLLGLWGGGSATAPVATAPPAKPSATTTGPAPAATTSTGGVMQRQPELAYDDDPTGTIRLEGQVIDDKDQPVAGARVAIDANPAKTVVTEADGGFTFEGLIARDYRVEATAEEGYAGPARVRLTPTPEPVTLRLRRAGQVEVVVTGPDGLAIKDAVVELRSTLLWTATTGADGVATLHGVGAVWAPLAIRATGFAPAAMMLSTTGDPAAPTRIAVALGKGAAIAGKVIDEAGKPVAGARVVATAMSEPFPVVDPRRDGVESAADGSFSIPALAAGTWRLTATHVDRAPGMSTPITIDGIHERTGVQLVLEAGAVLRGVVKDPKGAPVASADVRVVVRGHTFWRARREAFTATDGTFTIRGLPRRSVDVVASHERGASPIVAADLAAKLELEVTLTLEIVGSLEGTVVDSTGQPIGDAQVIAEPVWSGGTADREAWSVRGEHQTVTDQAGAFRFPGLPEATYRVRAARPGASEAALELAQTHVAKPGDPKLKIVLGADGRVTGKVVFADGKVPASFTVALGASPPTPFATKDGAFSIPAVAGTHTLVVDGRGFLASKAQDVVIVEGKATDAGTITVVPGRSISGRVLDPSGVPVAKAKVAAGMLITGGGAELYIPDESIGAKDAETDADGRFTLEGFPPAAVTVIAGKAEVGRSASVRIPAGPDSARLELVLQPTAGLGGTITRDGKPLGDTVVIANPIGASSAAFFVTTGADGTFALDALAPGPYLVYPMIGGGGNRPKDMYVRKVEVVLGARASVTIDATPGPVTLAVSVKTTAGAKVPMAQVFAVQATVTPHTVSELRDLDQLPVFGDTPLPLYIRGAMDGAAEITGMRPGKHTICIVPMSGPPPTDLDTLPLTCVGTTLGTAAKAKLDVVVPAPKP